MLKEIKNWHPVSLLCMNYRILSKTLVSRLREAMEAINELGKFRDIWCHRNVLRTVMEEHLHFAHPLVSGWPTSQTLRSTFFFTMLPQHDNDRIIKYSSFSFSYVCVFLNRAFCVPV